MLDISEIQDTIRKNINVFHVLVGMLFALVPLFISYKILTNEQVANGLRILGFLIIGAHLLLFYLKNKEMVEDDTTRPPDTTGAPVKEEYGNKVGCPPCVNHGGWNPLRCKCCAGRTYNPWWGTCDLS